MGEPTITTEVLPPFGGGPIIPPTFAKVVERFCLEQAELRARLAQAGDGLWATAHRVDHNCKVETDEGWRGDEQA